MKPSRSATRKYLLFCLLGLSVAPALASPFESVFIGPAQGMLAQMGPEERRALKERWEQASPEERLKLRREYRERMLRNPSQRGNGRDEFARDDSEAWRDPANDRDRSRYQRDGDDNRFGTGFERRRGDGGRFEPPGGGNVPNPEDFMDRRHGGRDRNRP